MGKGENAGNQYFLPLPKCFLTYQRTKAHFYHISMTSKDPLNGLKFVVWERINRFPNNKF